MSTQHVVFSLLTVLGPPPVHSDPCFRKDPRLPVGPGDGGRWSGALGGERTFGWGSAMMRDLGGEGTAFNEGMAVLEGTPAMGTQGKRELGVETRAGLRFPRVYTRPGVNPYDEVEWELRTASFWSEAPALEPNEVRCMRVTRR